MHAIMSNVDRYKTTQYGVAVMLILSSIALAIISLLRLDNVVSGVLIYIAQSFLLVASIFGLDYYVRIMSNISQSGHRTGYQKQ